MKAPLRLGLLLVGLCGLLLTASGCNMIGTAMYVFSGEDKKPAECKRLAFDDKKKLAHVVILPSMALETRPEFLRVDRELHAHLHSELQKGFNHNEEQVSLLQPRTIEKFKDENPSWQTLSDEEIAKKFRNADYVVRIDIDNISLYEPGSSRQLYRGKLEGRVSVFDAHKPDEYPIRKDFSITYPGESKASVPVGENNPQQFRSMFLAHAARRLSWFFTAHAVEDDFHMQD
jgi:hypothetical protein